ncbi:MAG TPA: NAD(P)H-hydrate dehydratase [Thermoanaerobaculia bacterium]|nr:NAD(P)H-hydrate dehydratase [Thermoanaerobaculia bacterium]
MRVLSPEAMRRVDRRAVEEVGLPSLVLMENAALGVVEAIAELHPEAERVAIFCGPGNNGGDGLAVARHLDVRGYDLEVWLVGGRELAGDAAVQLRVCEHQQIDIHRLDEDALPTAFAGAAAADLVVDALFGTGLDRPLEGFFAAVVDILNDLPVPLLAIDLPSGLAGGRAEPIGPHVVADATVTFAAPKTAHILWPAAGFCGELVVADLGIPPGLVDEAEEDGGWLHLLHGPEVAGWLPERGAESHKGTYGHLLVVAGSTGKGGAAVMTARAAVRAGAGLVTAAVPAAVLPLVQTGCVEAMALALPAGEEGRIGSAAVAAVLAAAEGKDVVALGPGLGQGEETAAAVREIVLALDLPLVLDADGLNAFAGRAAELRGRGALTVLTPHPGELARLLGTTADVIQEDRLGAARRAAEETAAVVVLKGHQTLVAVPPSTAGEPGAVWISPTGNPGMASGGSGDALTGVLGALVGWVGREVGPLEAVGLGVFVHGLAGDLAAATVGEVGLAASDLIAALPVAFRQLPELE